MTQVFISYSRKDIEFIQRLANDLKAAGFEVWYDLSGLEAGTRWGNEIQKAIHESQYFLVVLSPNSVRSDWVEREFLYASDQGLKIIPLLYEPCKLPMWSLHLQFIDVQEKNYTRNYPELLKIMGVSPEGKGENPIATRYIEIGDEYRKMGQDSNAIESYQQALKVDPGNLKALCSVGAVYLGSQSYAEAAASFDLALQVSDGDLVARSGWSDANMALGNQARADGDPEEAARFYLAILKVVPDEATARLNLVNLTGTRVDSLLESGQEDEAEKMLNEILAVIPDEAALGSMLKKLQDEKRTRVIHEKMIRSEQELAGGDWEKAIQTLNEALEIAPGQGSILKKIEQIRRQKNQEKLDAILGKVDQAEKEERWDTALAGLNEYLQLKPEDSAIQKRMTELMASKRAAWLSGISLRVDKAVANRNWDEARSALNEALGVEPDNRELKARAALVEADQLKAKLDSILLRAEQAASAGRWDDAVEILNNGITEFPEDKNLKNKLKDTLQARRKGAQEAALRMADLNARAGKWEEALKSINEVLAEEPDNRQFLEKYDQILRMEIDSKLKDLKKKAQDLMKANKLDEALALWKETLSIETVNRQAVMDEIEAVMKAQKLEREYAEALQAFTDKEYQKALNLFKEIEAEAGDYKDTSKLRQKAEKRWRPAQKTAGAGKKRTWLTVGLLAILVLGIGGVALWQLVPAIPAMFQTGTPASVAGSTSTASANNNQAASLPYQKTTNPDNVHQYTYFDDPISWNGAVDYCAKEGGYLVTIQDADENDFVFDISEGTTWLGGSDMLNSGTWAWVSGEPWLYPNWSQDQLTGDKQNSNWYLALEGDPEMKWVTFPIEKRLPFTCEWDYNLAQIRSGETIVVTSANDSGTGTLRQAILDAQAGDTITFDPAVFPPDDPTTIFVLGEGLPGIRQDYLTIDASNAGVILDGREKSGEVYGLRIDSDWNTVMGLQIINFPTTGLYLEGGSFNRIGGDRSIGAGPTGQGNMLVNNLYVGISILPSCEGNVITGNLIGTSLDGSETVGNMEMGILFEGLGQGGPQSSHPSPNIVGPDNVIAYNGISGGNDDGGILLDSVQVAAFITANSIHGNAGAGIAYGDNPDGDPSTILEPPRILYFNLDAGLVSGQTCAGCVVEIFSTDSQDGKTFEGMVLADEYGIFTFNKGSAFSEPFLTATTRSSSSGTSEFSEATSASSDIQNALDWIQINQPIYQTGFDTLSSWSQGGILDNGKLILTSQDGSIEIKHQISGTDQMAVEFDFRIVDGNYGNNHCFFNVDNGRGESLLRLISTGYNLDQQIKVWNYSNIINDYPLIGYAENILDVSSVNTVNLIILGDQIVLFINGEYAYSTLDPAGPTFYTYLGFLSEYYITCEFDNLKLWDLSGVDLNP